MNIASLIGDTFWVYLPAMIANMAPVIADRYNVLLWLNKPLDFGKKIQGTRILGSHKTIRGAVVAIVAGAATGVMQALIIHQEIFFGLFAGSVFGFGAIAGDAIKSFFKRRLGISPGSKLLLFDQVDFVIGATIFGIFFVRITIPIFITAIIFIGCASYAVSFIGVALHIKKSL